MTAAPPPVLPGERPASGIARLAVRYRGRLSPETVQRLIVDSYERLAEQARIRSHLVALAEHLASESLELAHVEGAPGRGLPRVLFVCSLPPRSNTSRGAPPPAAPSRPPSSPTARADTQSFPPPARTRRRWWSWSWHRC